MLETHTYLLKLKRENWNTVLLVKERTGLAAADVLKLLLQHSLRESNLNEVFPTASGCLSCK